MLTNIFTLIILTNLTVCGQTKSITDKQNIDLTSVDFIEINNNSRQVDTTQITHKRLTYEQTKLFVDKWNMAKSIGPCKYIVLYWINIIFKDGTKRTFRINGNNVKENNDWCYDIGDLAFINNAISGQKTITGTYGVYLDWSTYTELTIKENQTFEYIDRGFTGIGYKNYGKWKIKNGKLILYDYTENNSFHPMPTTWIIKKNELCNDTKKHKKKGQCLKLKTN
ncbi:MAG: hypothetical protein D8M18_10530 [Bacteroidetes bacterium]|nr:hypothetical protein [Bacteroidota bacterium]GIK70535.1 MAG: hypothetical protein BroJett020_18300 [Bacteroidota bacterium]